MQIMCYTHMQLEHFNFLYLTHLHIVMNFPSLANFQPTKAVLCELPCSFIPEITYYFMQLLTHHCWYFKDNTSWLCYIFSSLRIPSSFICRRFHTQAISGCHKILFFFFFCWHLMLFCCCFFWFPYLSRSAQESHKKLEPYVLYCKMNTKENKWSQGGLWKTA